MKASFPVRFSVSLAVCASLCCVPWHQAVADSYEATERSAASSPVQSNPLIESGADPEVEVPKFWEFLTDLPKDLKTFGQGALTPEGLVLMGGITAMTAVQVATDFETWQAARIPTIERQTVRKVANAGVSIGDGFFQFGIVGAFAATGGVLGDKKMLRTASQITESILATGIVVQIIKHVTGRESPFSSESRTGVWRVFPNQAEYMKDFQKYDAVPSGHLSTAVTTFIVIQENYPDQAWIPWVGWPVMGLVAFSLAGTSIHWWSDYPIAVGLGYSFAKIITAGNRPRTGDLSSSKWRPLVVPTLSSTGDPILMAGWTF